MIFVQLAVLLVHEAAVGISELFSCKSAKFIADTSTPPCVLSLPQMSPDQYSDCTCRMGQPFKYVGHAVQTHCSHLDFQEM